MKHVMLEHHYHKIMMRNCIRCILSAFRGRRRVTEYIVEFLHIPKCNELGEITGAEGGSLY